MSFLSKLFGSRSSDSGAQDVEAQLARLEREAEDAMPGFVGSSYNRAGDLALRSGQSDRAVGYYGRAIDAFLEDGQREAARGVANKIIRVRPAAVRTLCTLTWLDLASRHQATALLHLRDYAEAAREANQRVRAATQVFEMARRSDSGEFLDAAADALDALTFPNRAREVRGWATAGRAPEAISDNVEVSEACLAAAVRSNDPDTPFLVDGDAGDGAVDASTEAGAHADEVDGTEGDDAGHDETPAGEADGAPAEGKPGQGRKPKKGRKKKR